MKIGRLPRLVELTEAHRSHLYQRWTQSGESHKYVTTAYALWAAVSGAIALAVFFELVTLPIAWTFASIPATALLIYSRRFPSA